MVVSDKPVEEDLRNLAKDFDRRLEFRGTPVRVQSQEGGVEFRLLTRDEVVEPLLAFSKTAIKMAPASAETPLWANNLIAQMTAMKKIAALDAKVTALDTTVTALDAKVTALDTEVTALDAKAI